MAKCSKRIEWKNKLEALLCELTPEEKGRFLRDLRADDGRGRPLPGSFNILTVQQWADSSLGLRSERKLDAFIYRALVEHRWYPETRGGVDGPWSAREVSNMRDQIGRTIDERGPQEACRIFNIHFARDLHSLRIMGSAKKLAEAFEKAGVVPDVR